MTAQDITDFVSERGTAISRADISRLNEMLIDLPLEEVSDVRAWLNESVALIVNAPEYEGDIAPMI